MRRLKRWNMNPKRYPIRKALNHSNRNVYPTRLCKQKLITWCTEGEKKAETQILRAISYDIRGPRWIRHPCSRWRHLASPATHCKLQQHLIFISLFSPFFPFLSYLRPCQAQIGNMSCDTFLTAMLCTVERFTMGKRQSIKKGMSIKNKKGASS